MTVLEKIRNGLIVSCQAEEGSPFNTPKGVGDFARCAELGGAVGIRSCGVEKKPLYHAKHIVTSYLPYQINLRRWIRAHNRIVSPK